MLSEQCSSLPTSAASVSPQPEMKDLDLIKLLDWEGVGLQLGIKDYELQKVKRDYQRHDDRKREMFRVWLRACANTNYPGLIEALERAGEKGAVQQVKTEIAAHL